MSSNKRKREQAELEGDWLPAVVELEEDGTEQSWKKLGRVF